MATFEYQSERARAIWRRCLASAFRTALACTIVGCITLYGPKSLNEHVTLPAFSYVTVILIVTDATFGDTLHGFLHAFYATIPGVLPSILSLWLIGPARLTATTTAVAVALSAFVVVLPKNTHLISKRIALGQIVLIYVIAFIKGGATEPVMHPVHVAASTAVGVFACVLALLLPYPYLAYCEVKQNCKLFVENASERLNLFVKAISMEEEVGRQALVSQAKSLAVTGSRLLQNIKSKQESMKWESIPFKYLVKFYCPNPGDRLGEIETILRGMQIALTNCKSFPLRFINSQQKDNNILINLEETVTNQVKKTMPFGQIIVPNDSQKGSDFYHCYSTKLFKTLETNIPFHFNDLPSLFFLFCCKLFEGKPSNTTSSHDQHKEDGSKDNNVPRKTGKFWANSSMPVMGINKKRLIPAIRCSLSLGFAVFFGSVYSKENGYWSGLPVAISLASAREATFKVANLKAQGTVLGTVYGVVGCFVFERYVKIRFISLLPWFIVSSFLRRSKMYGQAGGISAVIGAVLILGRKGFGPPSEFAIERIIETFIGLSCSIVVDLLLQPTRASTLAKVQLSSSLRALHECVGYVDPTRKVSAYLEESQNKLRKKIDALSKFIAEADAEPNFWFIPFHSGCYGRLLASLSKAVDFLLFGAHALRSLEQESTRVDGGTWEEVVEKLENDLKLSRERLSCAIKCLEEVISVKSFSSVDQEFEKRKNSHDLELGKCDFPNGRVCKYSIPDDNEMMENMESFLGHLEEVLFCCIKEEEEEAEAIKGNLVLSMGGLAFCMNGLVKETREIEKAIKEVVQGENPTSQVNLHDILCKIHALENK